MNRKLNGPLLLLPATTLTSHSQTLSRCQKLCVKAELKKKKSPYLNENVQKIVRFLLAQTRKEMIQTSCKSEIKIVEIGTYSLSLSKYLVFHFEIARLFFSSTRFR